MYLFQLYSATQPNKESRMPSNAHISDYRQNSTPPSYKIEIHIEIGWSPFIHCGNISFNKSDRYNAYHMFAINYAKKNYPIDCIKMFKSVNLHFDAQQPGKAVLVAFLNFDLTRFAYTSTKSLVLYLEY